LCSTKVEPYSLIEDFGSCACRYLKEISYGTSLLVTSYPECNGGFTKGKPFKVFWELVNTYWRDTSGVRAFGYTSALELASALHHHNKSKQP
jgi:hypothetical protein